MKFNNLIIFLSRIKIILIEPNSKKSKKWNFMRLRYFDIEVWVFHIWIHTAKIQYLEHRQDYKFFIWVVHMVFSKFDIHILKLHFLKIFSKLFCLFIDMLRGFVNWKQNLPCAFTRSRCVIWKTEEFINKSFYILFVRLVFFLHILLYLCMLYLKVLKTYVFQVFGNYSKYLIFNISSKCYPLSFLGWIMINELS